MAMTRKQRECVALVEAHRLARARGDLAAVKDYADMIDALALEPFAADTPALAAGYRAAARRAGRNRRADERRGMGRRND